MWPRRIEPTFISSVKTNDFSNSILQAIMQLNPSKKMYEFKMALIVTSEMEFALSNTTAASPVEAILRKRGTLSIPVSIVK